MCIGGEALPSSLSVLRTLRSVWIGSLEPLGGIRMVCYMYYTDVFVGHNKDNIEKLKSALEAELNGFNSNDLTQLVQGLCLFMGYPSCLCKPKKSVKESLERISEELIQDFEAVQSCVSITTLTLNCDSCQSDVVCKCCVLDCINEVQTSCDCVQDSKNTCSCSSVEPKRCCKDLLEKLKASLSLLNLKADMEKLCSCPDVNCCNDGVCKGSLSCPVCNSLQNPNASKDYTVTGLGLLRPSPKRLAGRLNDFFGSGPKGSNPQCTCKCGSGTPKESCCCLACPGNCSQACSPGCLCPQASGTCPRKKFCQTINDIKIPAQSTERTCCEGGQKCHCEVDTPNCQATSTSSSGQKCCIVQDKSNYKHSIKCMIRRLVKFFASLDSSSKNFKSCCDLLCVAKTCYFLWDSYQNNKNGVQTFKEALQELKHSSPCGQDLYRVLDAFLQCCFNIFKPEQKFVENKVKAFQENCKCKDATKSKQSPPSPCNCCSKPGSSYSCLACHILFENSELKSLFRQEFVSSYTYKSVSSFEDSSNATSASWDSLCPKSGKCCGLSSCNSCSSGQCPPGGCCPDCPQRKAAKIFLGMLPCLYYGLKILYDRVQDPVTWPTWSQKNGQKNLVPASILHAPDLKKFLDAWGFESSHMDPSLQAMVLPGLLENLFSSGSLNSLFQTSKIYFTSFYSRSSPVSPSKDPLTVRQMLLWLYGLRFQKSFPSLVENCKSLCLPFGNSFNADAFCYYIYTCSFIFPVAIISFIEDSSSAQKVFSSSSEFSKFFYPSDPSDLFNMLFEYLRKIFAALNFLCIQCRLDRDSAGWRDCAYGQSCAEALKKPLSPPAPVTSTPPCCKSKGSHGILCTSVPGESNYHEHCISSKPDVKCIGLQKCNQVSGSAPTDAHSSGDTKCIASCPHPLLMFLIDGSESKSQAFSYSLFKLPDDSSVPRMGFSPDNLPSPGRHGRDLYAVLKVFCDDGFYPLTRLLKFLARISFHPPETLGEFFLFFKKLAEALNSTSDLSSKFIGWIDGEPGTYSGDSLKKALEDLYGSSHSSSSHTPANLFSLSSCHATKGSNASCGAYLYSLTEYSSDNLVEDLVDSYLSWVCYLTPKFKTLLEKFKEDFSNCCQSSSCKKIVECPCALPLIYSRGFQFMSPSGLGCVDSWGQEHGKHGGQGGQKEKDPKCTRRTCKNFITQLGKVISGQPLEALLKAIDEFLWSIRLPFFLFVLAFWAFVISYFLYVQLYKLDLFHLKSHAHFSRSFKILPSTLFSDASSKLKDLSYFTL
ncbi:variant erythrocyte surface antigen-1 family protein [Babesia divergens]|uniref:Variant erythrocyte surface antigen-1 family protein n=1 Tax=Babesia divergens TaxID=32595 RepID=A0AAD9LE46_BABDI|nr:variant erythrocyte surface antigen-1 family protein [Babesia divergens]